jgi:hypothetical protein
MPISEMDIKETISELYNHLYTRDHIKDVKIGTETTISTNLILVKEFPVNDNKRR